MLAFIVGTVAGDAVRGHELRAVKKRQYGRLEVRCHPRAIEILAALQHSEDDDDHDDDDDDDDDD